MEIALDAIHILIERGYLRGRKRVYITNAGNHGTAGEQQNIEDLEKQPKLTLMDLVVDTISKCSDEFDDHVQLQVINCLLTAVTSPYCEVHEASLLLAVRACFHIHLVTRNTVNKQTAKGALTQMLSAVYRRMEMVDSGSVNMDGTGNRNNNNGEATSSSGGGGDGELPYHQSMYPEVFDALGFRIASSGAAVTPLIDNSELSAMNSGTNGKSEAEVESGSAIMKHRNSILKRHQLAVGDGVDGEIVGDVAVAVSDVVVDMNDTNKAVASSETVTDASKAILTNSTPASTNPSNLSFQSIHHKDAFLLFRALCKLSMKGIHDDSVSNNNDPIALQNKLLSLQLILHILQNSGYAFKTGDKFIYAIRNYLCVSLLGNCTSQVAEVTGLGLHIFITLMENFKDHLKSELEIFINSLFLKILESEYSTYDHKMKVLEVFHNIVKDSSGLVEIFVNYDCDFEANNMFKAIVDAFAKIAKNPNLPQSRAGTDFLTSSIKKTQLEEKNVRSMGLEGLVMMLKSLLISSGIGVSLSMKDVLINNVNVANMLIAENSTHLSKSPKKINNNTANDATTTENEEAGEASTGTVVVEPTALNLPVENFDRKRKILEEIESGILKFNLSPRRGLAFLVSKGHIEFTPKDVSNFLHVYKDRLDKTMVGEYLGKEREYENGFCLSVLHEYVDYMDFHEMGFAEAMRYFLSGFRIPGEAQKIDRIMEKFAERYYLQNRETFISADMAFILAFSTIMLQTNLHNPAIKEDKRMSKEQFIKQNRGISADGELPEELLIDIYDNIAAKPISLTNDDSSSNSKKKGRDESAIPFTVFGSDKRRKDAFHNERKEMVKAGEAMIKLSRKKAANARKSVYVRTGGNSNPNNNPNLGLGLGYDMEAVDTNVSADEVYVKPMFDLSWAPMLGVFSQILETSDEPDLIQLCLTGFLYAVRLSSRLPGTEFTTAKQSFINALARFTTLETVKDMKPKNIECIRAMVCVALCDAEYLDESWFQVLQCISQLARLIIIGNGLHDDGVFIADNGNSNAMNNHAATPNTSSFFTNLINGTSNTPPAAVTSTNAAGVRRSSIMTRNHSHANITGSQYPLSGSSSSNLSSNPLDPFKIFSSGPSKAETARLIEESNALFILQENIDEKLIDRIIANSQYLSSSSVCHFIENLCEVSKFEITNDTKSVYAKESESSSGRIFGLQKLVEVADYNMHIRHRLDWARMWNTLASHFSQVGCHDNFYIAMYAIDSLKQLSIKFLRKDELSNFNFQRLFLKPFETIMMKSNSNDIRDIVLNCLDVMIKTCASNIRSGWKTIFSIFEVAVTCEKVEIGQYAYNITDRLLTQQFDLIVNDFVEIMHCLVAFVACKHTTISLAALNHLSSCAAHLAKGEINPVATVFDLNTGVLTLPPVMPASAHDSNNSSSTSMISEDASVFRLWWPLLLGLSARVGDSRLAVRTGALETLHQVLSEHGILFSAQAWSMIFKGVLFPIVDSATLDFSQQPVSRYPKQMDLSMTVNTSLSTVQSREALKNSWIGSTGLRVIQTITDLFDQFKYHICCTSEVPLLSDIITMLEQLIHQEVESVARLGLYGMKCLLHIINPSEDSDRTDDDEETESDFEEDEQDKRDAVEAAVVMASHGHLLSRPPRPVSLNSRRNRHRNASRKSKLKQQLLEGSDEPTNPLDSGVAPATTSNVQFHKDSCNVLAYRISNSLLRNLMIDYGEAGSIGEVPLPPAPGGSSSTIATPATMTKCPIYMSRIEHHNYDVGININRQLIDVTCSGAHVGVDANVSWGEKASGIEAGEEATEGGFTEKTDTESASGDASVAVPKRNNNTSASDLSARVQPVSWSKTAACAMTSMVVTLSSIEMLGDLLFNNYSEWSVEMFRVMLYTLELAHQHAVRFNQNHEIRMQLKLRHFMEFPDRIDRLPHLLDQEVESMTQVVLIALRLYADNENQEIKGADRTDRGDRRKFIEPYVQR